jgi:hypothetical protein
MKQLAALIGGLAIAGLVACGGARQTAPAPAAGEPSVPLAGETHAAIEALDAQIAADLDKLGIVRPPPPLGAAPFAVSDIVKPSADPTCTAGTSDTCKDTCTLADSICDNAGRICEIAGELVGDAWAAEKCASGKASCDAARERCCGCL